MDEMASRVDTSMIFTILCIYGGLAAIYVMQKTRYEAENQHDPKWIRVVYTISTASLAWAMFWCVTYAYEHSWQPWPPEIFLVFALDVKLTMRLLAMRARVKRTGPYYNAPSMEARRASRR